MLRLLAERVRTVRKARGLTQADLAAKAGISANTLVTMEKGAGSVQLGEDTEHGFRADVDRMHGRRFEILRVEQSHGFSDAGRVGRALRSGNGRPGRSDGKQQGQNEATHL